MPLTGQKGMSMEHKNIVMTLKLSWQEVSSLQTGIIGTILKRPVSCEASQDDMTYWDTAAIDGWFTLREIHLLLDKAGATPEEQEESIPPDADRARSLGMGLSNRLLRMALYADWDKEYHDETALWLIDYRKQPERQKEKLRLPGAEVSLSDLKSRCELLGYLFENRPTHTSLMNFCEPYQEEYRNDLCWQYPISDGIHAGTYLIPVREGIVSLPYDEMEQEDGEIFRLEDLKTFDADSMAVLKEDWESFSSGLMEAMNGMLEFLHQRERKAAK